MSRRLTGLSPNSIRTHALTQPPGLNRLLILASALRRHTQRDSEAAYSVPGSKRWIDDSSVNFTGFLRAHLLAFLQKFTVEFPETRQRAYTLPVTLPLALPPPPQARIPRTTEANSGSSGHKPINTVSEGSSQGCGNRKFTISQSGGWADLEYTIGECIPVNFCSKNLSNFGGLKAFIFKVFNMPKSMFIKGMFVEHWGTSMKRAALYFRVSTKEQTQKPA